jgi:hypothetical protein
VEPNDCNSQLWWESPDYWRGITLLNQGRYFEAHETLEDVWRLVAGKERHFLQGLIQVAVGLHHLDCGNCEGARGVLRRAASNLALFPASFGGIRAGNLLCMVRGWLQRLDASTVPPPRDASRPIVEAAARE